jgi:hypothetical protein
MDQLEIRHLFDKFINNSENLNWHGGGIDLETGELLTMMAEYMNSG